MSPLQAFWWQQTLDVWNLIAASPTDSLFHTILLDNIHHAFHVGRGAKNSSSSIATCLQSVGHSMPSDSTVVRMMAADAVIEVLREQIQGTHSHALLCPRAAPSAEVVSCTYYQWFRPFSKHRRYCQLPVSGRRMQCLLQFKLGSHDLHIVAGRFCDIARAHRVCTHCGGIAVAGHLHTVHECPFLQPLWQQYAALFTPK